MLTYRGTGLAAHEWSDRIKLKYWLSFKRLKDRSEDLVCQCYGKAGYCFCLCSHRGMSIN